MSVSRRSFLGMLGLAPLAPFALRSREESVVVYTNGQDPVETWQGTSLTPERVEAARKSLYRDEFTVGRLSDGWGGSLGQPVDYSPIVNHFSVEQMAGLGDRVTPAQWPDRARKRRG